MSFRPERLRCYVLILEAKAFLLLADVLVHRVRFGRWRATLGTSVRAERSGSPPPTAPSRSVPVVRAVERASRLRRTPYKCLPRAMALQWMLRRRGQGSTLIIGVADAQAITGKRDLHAWVEIDGRVVIGGETAVAHSPAFALTQG